jgi:hypothetical protein
MELESLVIYVRSRLESEAARLDSSRQANSLGTSRALATVEVVSGRIASGLRI